MAFYWEARAPPAPIQSGYRLETAPAGPEATAATGGGGASIAQMYILRSLQG